MTEKDINELRQEAKELGIPVGRTATKDSLSQAITEAKTSEPSLREKKEGLRRRRGGKILGMGSATWNRPEFKREGYVRRAFNDAKGRLQAAYDNDYEFVLDEAGNKIKQRGGTKEDGTDLIQYLMEKPIDWYGEDQKKKHELNELKEQAIKEGKTPGSDNEFKGVKQYQPREGISITSGRS